MVRRQLGNEARCRRLAGTSLALTGLLLMGAAFYPSTNVDITSWVPVQAFSWCAANPGACLGKATPTAPSEAEVEPWGVSDAERWAEGRLGNGNKGGRSLDSNRTGSGGDTGPTSTESIAQRWGEGSSNRTGFGDAPSHPAVHCSEDSASNSSMRALSQMLPGVGIVIEGSSQSDQGHADLLRRLYSQQLGFPESRMRRAVSNAGDPERLHRVLRKFIQGQPVHVATVGGSVTAGVGAESENLAYRERLFEWIRDTFPHEKHTFANGALAAASSTYIHQCIRDFVPPNTDLVIVEFTMNDSQRMCGVDNDGRRGFEILLRKLLLYRHAPAVIVLHWWSPRTKQFWQSAQDELDVFNRFYGVPSLSWRDAAHDLLASNATGFNFEDIYFDKGHPNGYNGHRYLAEMLIGFIRNEAALMLLAGRADDAIQDVSELRPLPEPMIEGNYEGNSYCMRGNAFRKAVIEHEGWEWQDEGKHGRHKWGWISWEPGARLVLQVNTKTYRGNSKILVGVGILTSYERMGNAELSCESGCDCEPKLLEGHTEDKVSQTEWVYHSVGQHEECRMSVTNVNSTADANGEHKFKVTSFLVTNVHNSSVPWFSHIDELAEKAVATARYRRGHLKRLAAKLKAEQEQAAAEQAQQEQAADKSGEETADKSGKGEAITGNQEQENKGEQGQGEKAQHGQGEKAGEGPTDADMANQDQAAADGIEADKAANITQQGREEQISEVVNTTSTRRFLY